MAAMNTQGKMLLLSSLLAKSGTISENGRALLKELTVQGKGICKVLVEAFEASSEGENLQFLRLVNEVIDGTMDGLMKDLFHGLSKRIEVFESSGDEPHLRAFLELLRRLGVADMAKFSAVASPRLGIAARMAFDFNTVTIVGDTPSEESRNKLLQSLFHEEAAYYLSSKQTLDLQVCEVQDIDSWAVDADGVCLGAASVRSGRSLPGLTKLRDGAIVVTCGEALPVDALTHNGLILAGSIPMPSALVSEEEDDDTNQNMVDVHIYQRQQQQLRRQEEEEEEEEEDANQNVRQSYRRISAGFDDDEDDDDDDADDFQARANEISSPQDAQLMRQKRRRNRNELPW